MVSALDVAAYILEQVGEIPAVKLQKLVYYSQAWSLVWDDAPLYSDRIEAWANGPVVPTVYNIHRGLYSVSHCTGGDSANLTQTQRDTIDKVIEFYGKHHSGSLTELTHKERPWLEARVGLTDGERGNHPITNADMAEYYSSL